MTLARRAAVLGFPIEHSRSPILHNAAYRALGLTGWTYERIECTAAQLPDLVGSLGPEWVGLSVTMPGKEAALAVAAERSARAELAGSANTLVRTASGWRADCTDIDGVTGALGSAGVSDLSGGHAIVVGAGGTARPALIALAELGVSSVAVVARDPQRAASALELAETLGLQPQYCAFDPAVVDAQTRRASVAISTVPAAAAQYIAGELATVPTVLDAIYDPWPTPLAEAVNRCGTTIVNGLSMLLHQAYGQVEQFTGQPAPRAAMATALRDSLGATR